VVIFNAEIAEIAEEEVRLGSLSLRAPRALR